jgi:hypothetical protein
MADWSSLRPLKNHSRIMTFIVIVLAGILVFTPRHIFRNQTEGIGIDNDLSPRVKATGGLSIREAPSVNGTILTTAPSHAAIIIIDENAASDNIGGKDGNWYKVEFQGVTGYAWGNYIDK